MNRVTVFIPVYNAEKYLRETLESILNQSYVDFELLIIDDGSTDDSINIINSFNDSRINLIKNEKNMGLPYTRNLALSIVNTEYLALMDADDICDRDRLKLQVEFLDKNKEIEVVGSDFQMFFPNGKAIYVKTPTNPDYIRAYLMLNICIANPSVMIRKEFLTKNNIKYREEYFACQDYSLWIDIVKLGKISNINKCLLRYRSGHDNISRRTANNRSKERKKLLDNIHLRGIANNGLSITENELKLINKIFNDNIKDNAASEDEINKLDKVFKKFKDQNNVNNKIDKKQFNKALNDCWYIAIKQSNIARVKKIIKIILNTHSNIYEKNVIYNFFRIMYKELRL